MELYIYRDEDNTVVATINGDSNDDCEGKARELNYDNDGFSWTYSPAIGINDGLIMGKDVKKIDAASSNYLTTTDAATTLNVNPSRVRQLILTGRLPAEKIGRDWQIKREDLDKIERGKPGPKPRTE